MGIPGLTIIGESINDSVPSTRVLFEAGDFDGIRRLAATQDEKGASYIDVNVGMRSPEFMAEIIRLVQSVTEKPLSIDTPDPATAEAGLRAYDSGKAGGRRPILNSISMLRMELLELYGIQPFDPILIVSERVEDGVSRPNRTASEIHATARLLLEVMKTRRLTEEQCIFDPGIAPIGSDTDGYTRTLMDALRLLKEDSAFDKCHRSVGLSNFTVMLPPKRPDGSPVKGALESAFLTRAIPLGLDHVIGSVSRKYQILDDDHPAMKCFDDVLRLQGYEVITRVQEFTGAAATTGIPLSELATCIERGKISADSPFPADLKGKKGVDELTREALTSGVPPAIILDECIKGMEAIGEKFSAGTAFVPDLLLAAKAMKTVMGHLKPHFLSGAVESKGTLVIGTVAGDLHDIGKNLAAMTIEGAGWKVVDLGADVSTQKFIDAVEENPGCVVGLSALLTTTMLAMEKTVAEIRSLFPKTKIIVGGAPVTKSFADRIGAHAYAANPQKGVMFLKTLER